MTRGSAAKRPRWIPLACCVAIALPASAAVGATWWQCDPCTPGDWFDANHWTAGVPGLSDYAYIDNAGTAVLSAGAAETHYAYVGHTVSGVLAQTGGIHAVNSHLFVSYNTGSTGTYELSGDGQLSAYSVHVGYRGDGTFTQTGGTNTVDGNLYLGYFAGSTGTYELSGDGRLSAAREYVGYNGSGTFTQTGGTHTVDYLRIGPDGRYIFSGGSLELGTFLLVEGEWDFAGSAAAAAWDHVGVNLLRSTVINAQNASLSLGPDTLMMVPAGFDPNVAFGSFSSAGRVHTAGQTLVIAVDEQVRWIGPIDDHVQCAGTLEDIASRDIDLMDGLEVTGAGNVDLGPGRLTVNDAVSGISGDGQLSAYYEYVGTSGDGTFTQTGGTHTISLAYLGYEAGSTGTYQLSGDGQFTADLERVGYAGSGTFTQTGGIHTVGFDGLRLGCSPGSTGIYELSGDGQLSVMTELYVGYAGSGTFTQTGGTHTISLAYLGYEAGSTGTYQLSGDGQLSADTEIVGCYGAGTFTQTGGTNTVHQLNVGCSSGSTGTYELSGDGQLSASNEYVGYFGSGNGTFTQTGGINTVGYSLRLGYYAGSSGTYELSGDGQLSADREYVGYDGQGVFVQDGGTNTVTYLAIGTDGRYVLTGGTLQCVFMQLDGALDFGGSTAFVVWDNMVLNLASGQVLNAGNASLVLGSNTLMMVAPGLDPNTAFGSFGSDGVVHTTGSTLVIPEGMAFSWCGTVEDHVECAGTITRLPNLNMFLNGGLALSGGGFVDLGSGSVTVDDQASGVSGGQLNCYSIRVGHYGAGTFTQTGGAIKDVYLYLGHQTGSTGTYVLGGDGELSAAFEYVGYKGDGTFKQTGGANTVGYGGLSLGYEAGVTGTCELSGDGQLSTRVEYVGYDGNGVFAQTGGTNTVELGLYLGYSPGSTGTYELGGDGELSADKEYIGHKGIGRFTQTGGIHTVAQDLRLGYYAGSTGTYELSDGELSVGSEYCTGTFIQTGGFHTVSQDLYTSGVGVGGVYELSGGQLSATRALFAGHYSSEFSITDASAQSL